MKKGALLLLLSTIFFLSLLSLDADALPWCPSGSCDPYDPPNCAVGQTQSCQVSDRYGAGTGCQLGTSTCYFDTTIGENIWGSCTGWQTADYESPEASCDDIDNDCDSFLDEDLSGTIYGLCFAGNENCFNKIDDDGDSLVDCQDNSYCSNTLSSNSLPGSSTWLAPLNASGLYSYVSDTLSLGYYEIWFNPIPGHNYQTRRTVEIGGCCQRDASKTCIEDRHTEKFTLRDLTSGSIVSEQTRRVCGSLGSTPTSSDWVWTEIGPGLPDCNYWDCTALYTWNDFGFNPILDASCAWFQGIGPGDQTIVLPAGELINMVGGNNSFYIGNESVEIGCRQYAATCNPGPPPDIGVCGHTCVAGVDMVDLQNPGTDPIKYVHPYGSLAGIMKECTYGDTLLCADSSSSCQLLRASIVPAGCSAGLDSSCEVGENIVILYTYTGNCLTANVNNIQVDASAPGGVCDIEYTANPSVEISNSMNAAVSLTDTTNFVTKTENWQIRSIPSSCQGMTISPVAASFYANGQPGTGTWIDGANDAGDTLSGSFTFYGLAAAGSSTTTTTVSGSSTTSTTLGGGSSGPGLCGDGVRNYGEQCDTAFFPDPRENPECIAIGATFCDNTGFFTDGIPCRCYNGPAQSPSVSGTVIITTNCQDDGDGDSKGKRTETTRTIVNGAVAGETSQTIPCDLPPLDIPFFSIINMLAAILILGIYYIANNRH